VRQHETNFDLLETQTASRARKLANFVQNEDCPHERFRSAKDYYEAVQEALGDQVAALREKTEHAYADAFDTLEQKRDELGVDNIIPDRSSKLSKIQRADNLATLKNELNTVSDFRATYLARLNDAAEREEEGGGKTSEIFNVRGEISRHQLESEDDVEAFVSDLRDKLLARVRDDKIVIIK